MELDIFGNSETEKIEIEQAAQIANVSTSTIRNWIKTGYLEHCGKGFITKASFDNTLNNIIGVEKLNKRANKLYKLPNTHTPKESDYLLDKTNTEDIGLKYLNSLSDADRNKEGIYYTPQLIIADMFKGIDIQSNSLFLDPCCGSGNFIIEAIKLGVNPQNVYGFDTDPNAITITKKRIKADFGYDSQNIVAGDFLQIAQNLIDENKKFDLIFTNPPWGKKIDKKQKLFYARLYNCRNSHDTTSLFLAASFLLLKPNGYLGFLVQEALFNIASYEDIRKIILDKKILRLIDYGRPFKGLITKAHSIVLKNDKSTNNDTVECSYNNTVFSRKTYSFSKNPNRIINFWANDNDTQVIEHLYQIDHITLKDKAKWGMGIVTGNNNKFCTNQPQKGYFPIYKGSDITKHGLKPPTTFITSDFSQLQQVAPTQLYYSQEKVIYKFISTNLCFFYDNEQRLILNSANFFVPFNLPIDTKRLTQLLNSDIINWLFRKLFNTHKILRSNLEQLPIHYKYFDYYNEFSEQKYLYYLNLIKLKNGTYAVAPK